MKLQLKPLFSGEVAKLPFETAIDASAVSFQDTYPLKDVRATGDIVAHSGPGDTVAWLALWAQVDYVYAAPCDRCAADMQLPQSFTVTHTLVSEVAAADSDEADDLVLVDSHVLALDKLLLEDLILQIPGKHLCMPDCKGLCPRCGQNLNEEACGCRLQETDPRWDALKQLLD